MFKGSTRASVSLCPSSVYSLICKKHWSWEYCIFICYWTPICSCFSVRIALQSPGLDATFPCSVGDLHHWPSLPPALHRVLHLAISRCLIFTSLVQLSSAIGLGFLSSLWECLVTAFGMLMMMLWPRLYSPSPLQSWALSELLSQLRTMIHSSEVKQISSFLSFNSFSSLELCLLLYAQPPPCLHACPFCL